MIQVTFLKFRQDDNIMISAQSDGSFSVTFIDFGLSRLPEDPSEKDSEMNELQSLMT
jgi:hypothetical protein